MGYINGMPEKPNQQGWKQFLTARNEMLHEFDKAKVLSDGRGIHVEHGNVGEASFRKWLAKFLPKRYAVTSGYIISTGLTENERTPHYDVIIYDQLESPILWRTNNPDDSQQGESLAIPAEFVHAVFEIKSRYNRKNMAAAIDHLLELTPLAMRINPDQDGQNLYLPNDFFWGIVFFEYAITDIGNLQTLNYLWNSSFLRGFMEGIILRHRTIIDQSGTITLCSLAEGSIVEPKADVFSEVRQGMVYHTSFSSGAFTSFAMKILSHLHPQGKYIRYAYGGPDHQWVK